MHRLSGNLGFLVVFVLHIFTNVFSKNWVSCLLLPHFTNFILPFDIGHSAFFSSNNMSLFLARFSDFILIPCCILTFTFSIHGCAIFLFTTSFACLPASDLLQLKTERRSKKKRCWHLNLFCSVLVS